MAYENSGLIAFANSLNNAGQMFGNALQQRYAEQKKQQYLADLAPLAKAGDYAGISEVAFKYGDAGTAMQALQEAQKIKLRNEQNASDAAAFGSLNGGAAPAGVTGGVTQNPQPNMQPMNLPGAMPSKAEISQYIVESAKARGIDPGIAMKVAQSEGLGAYTGDQNSSFGPFQLHYGGVAKGGNAVPGLGDEFTKATGLDARNPQTWKQQVDFSLDQAKKGGWGPWHGWKGDQWAGIGRGVQVADASGAIPQSAVPNAAPQPQPSPLDALMARRQNIVRALGSQGISDNARAQLNLMLKDTEFQIERADKQAQKTDVKQFGDTVYSVSGGQLIPLQKVEKSPQEKALTADQSNAAGFADRMVNAEKVLSDQNLQGAVMGTQGVENNVLGKIPMVGAKWQSPEFKRYERAKKDFITAVLRKESGASIQPSEFHNEEVKYFPQPWDDPQTIADKAQARQIAIQSMQRASGPAQSQSQPSASGGKPIPSTVMSEARAAIATKGREAVINRLREQGFDTSGL